MAEPSKSLSYLAGSEGSANSPSIKQEKAPVMKHTFPSLFIKSPYAL